jgi:hypothetical protein
MYPGVGCVLHSLPGYQFNEKREDKMSNRIELPGDHWADIKDPMEITERELSPLKEAFLKMEDARRVRFQRWAPLRSRGQCTRLREVRPHLSR